MTQTVYFSDFCDAFTGSYENKFSYEGKRALFDYLENLEEDTGEQIQFDMVAICCDYSEYKTAYEAMEQYRPDDMPVEGEPGDDLIEIQEKNEAKALEWLEENTSVIKFDGGIIIQQF